MIGSPTQSSIARTQPLTVPDAATHAIVQALLESDLLGVALVRAGDAGEWIHVLTNAAYDAILGGQPVVGSRLTDVLPPEVVPEATFEAVLATGRSARVPKVLLPERTGEDVSVPQRYVTFTLIPVQPAALESASVLVLARDSSKEVHDERIANLFLLLARDMTAERDEAATIRSAVKHAKEALGASAASIFLLGADRKGLHGALVGWDWTRTSFVADLEQWPNVARAIAANEPCHFTAASAEGAEEGWFESRGIKAAICAPMAADGRVVGVLFFDYSGASEAAVDLALAKTVADQCALLVERESARVGMTGL